MIRTEEIRLPVTNGRSVRYPRRPAWYQVIVKLPCTDDVHYFRPGTREWHARLVWIVNDKRTFSQSSGFLQLASI